jgi:Tol biopolymer transport system component
LADYDGAINKRCGVYGDLSLRPPLSPIYSQPLALTPGTRLGPYEVVCAIGAGGMGEVYRATDTKLKRRVAIKILPPALAADHDRLTRFQREAEVLASLNHPNIAGIYGVEESGGATALVMELVEGEDLSAIIARGRIPVADAMPIAKQIADALEAAHEQGIVHRDLKPANIKVRPDGTVKVLDFGLAKALGPEGGSPTTDASNSPTTLGLTEVGMILGTAAYMAPEQARGKSVDKRADIWAFGVVLYEMVTGRRAFEVDDVSSILASVLKTEPRWDDVPSEVRRLLESCLQKDPRKRLRDIADAWKLVDRAPAPTATPQSRVAQFAWVAAGLFAAVAAASLWTQFRRAAPPAAQPVVQLDVDLGADVSLASLTPPTFSSIAISPDGTRIVYVASVSGGPLKLLTRQLDQTPVTELADTVGVVNPSPFFSPDGQWVGFWNGKGVVKVSVEGGSAVPVGDVTPWTGGTWGDDGSIVVGSGSPFAAALLRMPSDGGRAESIMELAKGELFYTSPRLLPDGRSVLVAVVRSPPSVENTTVEVLSIADRHRKMLVRAANTPRYVSSGHLVYMKGPSMLAVPFDLDRLETRGSPVVVLDDVAQDSVGAAAQFDVSRTGTLVYRRARSTESIATVSWLDTAGKQEPVLAKPGAYGLPRLSPDGRRLALTIRDGGESNIWLYDFQRGAMQRVTSGGGTFSNPVWSADGRYLIFGSYTGMFWTRTDAVQPQVLVATKSIQFPTSFTSNGSRLAFTQVDAFPQLWTVPLEDSGGVLKAGNPERLLPSTTSNDIDAAFSPDGRWIAYASNRSGLFEVYVKPASGSPEDGGPGFPVSSGGGLLPRWSPNGRELLYRAGERIMTVSYTISNGAFLAEKAAVWAANARPTGGFDVAPGGRRVIVAAPVAEREAPQSEHTIAFVQNFFEELRRRAPVGP